MWGCIKVASRFGFGAAGCRFLAPLFLGLLPTPGALADQEVPRIEFFTGFEASDNYTSAYVGGGYAFGKGFHQESMRLRAVGSLGRYHYDGSLESGGVWVPTRFDGEASFLAALAGYEFHFGRVISKIFAGVEAVDQRISPRDPNNSVQGSEMGFRVVARELDRPLADLASLRRCRLRYGLPGILELGAHRLSLEAKALGWRGGRRARQPGIRCWPRRRLCEVLPSRYGADCGERLHGQLLGGRSERLRLARSPARFLTLEGISRCTAGPASGSAWPRSHHACRN